jgi:outer membrane protein OmpA-like peptidoglycan-associated protein
MKGLPKIFMLFFALLAGTLCSQHKSKLNIYFGFNEYTLSVENIEILDKFIYNKPIHNIRLKGFCDTIGSIEYNDLLALKRVLAVKKHLLSKKIKEETIHTQANGERVLLKPGSGEKERALNRRVELEMEFTGLVSGKSANGTTVAAGNKKKVDFSGTLTDEENHPIEAEIVLSDYVGKEVLTTKSNKNGQYNFSTFLNLKGIYSFTLYNDETFIGEQTINLNNSYEKYTNIKTILPKLKGGRSYAMKNLNFYGSEARLLPQSIPSLEALCKLMRRNKTLMVEIQGHVNFPKYAGDPKKHFLHRIRISGKEVPMKTTYFGCLKHVPE